MPFQKSMTIPQVLHGVQVVLRPPSPSTNEGEQTVEHRIFFEIDSRLTELAHALRGDHEQDVPLDAYPIPPADVLRILEDTLGKFEQTDVLRSIFAQLRTNAEPEPTQPEHGSPIAVDLDVAEQAIRRVLGTEHVHLLPQVMDALRNAAALHVVGGDDEGVDHAVA
jgi:hypothetical protein